MKSLRASGSDVDYKTNVSRPQQQNVKNSSNVCNPKEATTLTIGSNSASNTNTTKKHGLGFRRFSLRRIFNPSSIGRTVNAKHRTTKDNHSESGSAADNKVFDLTFNFKITVN